MAARIMVISAHPADFCSRSGGTLIRHIRAGGQARVVWLSHGETDESKSLVDANPGIALDAVRRIRAAEAVACAEVIGAEGRMLGYSDDPLRMSAERLEELGAEVASFAPDVVLTHWRDEFTYPTHWIAADAALRALRHVKGTNDVRFFEPNIGTAARVGFVPDHYVDITEVFAQKVEALGTLAAQPHLVEMYTVCNRWRGIESGCTYAEAFVRHAPMVPLLQEL